MSQKILLAKRDGIATITINRPVQRNAITYEMWQQLTGFMAELKTDPGVRVVIFRGAGTEAFSAGADIGEFEDQRRNSTLARRYHAAVEEALEAIGRQRPDVILLDLLMPRLDGFAVIEHLQQDPRHRAIPVVVLTAKDLTATERTVLEQSVLKVIHKLGLSREAFIDELRTALAACRNRHPRDAS